MEGTSHFGFKLLYEDAMDLFVVLIGFCENNVRVFRNEELVTLNGEINLYYFLSFLDF